MGVGTARVNYQLLECLFLSRNATQREREDWAGERKTGRERVCNLRRSEDAVGHYCFQENKLLEKKKRTLFVCVLFFILFQIAKGMEKMKLYDKMESIGRLEDSGGYPRDTSSLFVSLRLTLWEVSRSLKNQRHLSSMH